MTTLHRCGNCRKAVKSDGQERPECPECGVLCHAIPTPPPVRKVCKTCGSENVAHDAWAVWSVEHQWWELGEHFDYAYCHDCDGETKIIEKPLEIADA